MLLLTAFVNSFGQAFLTTPILGKHGKDFIIVNYVDWVGQGYQDAYCGTKSYDGHQGTDYVIRSFSQMDSGVNVLAADSGIITFIQDGIFDREVASDTSKGLGNYIAIKHPNSYFTYYGHLKKNSILVQVGDTVRAGQMIGEVGSSGNSTDPHLHFELWFDSLYVVDPFNGDCGNDSTLWLDSLIYDTTFKSWGQGYYLKNIDINTLREREKSNICCPYELNAGNDTLTFWSHMYGLRDGDTLTINWNDSSNTTQYSYDFILDKDYWYYYFWSYITTDSLKVGNWQTVLLRNGEEVLREDFEVKLSLTTGITEQKEQQKCIPFNSISFSEWRVLLEDDAIGVYQLNGRKVDVSHFFLQTKEHQQRTGIFIIRTSRNNQTCTYKVLY